LKFKCLLFLLVAALLTPHTAVAGPPFLTDDPDPAEYKHWEVYTFSQATHVSGSTTGTAPSVEANYGAFQGVHLHILAPLAFNKTEDDSANFGFGDMEMGAKFRFIDEDDNDLGLKVATFPAFTIPTGDRDRDFGAGHGRYFIPLWLQKSFGDWTTYGGGGYEVNPGQDNKDYWFFGWELQRKLTENLLLGAEIFHQTIAEAGGQESTGFNIGTIYDLNENHHLLFSGGRGIQNANTTNELTYYLGFLLTF
jgi:hypothetical protein